MSLYWITKRPTRTRTEYYRSCGLGFYFSCGEEENRQSQFNIKIYVLVYEFSFSKWPEKPLLMCFFIQCISTKHKLVLILFNLDISPVPTILAMKSVYLYNGVGRSAVLESVNPVL